MQPCDQALVEILHAGKGRGYGHQRRTVSRVLCPARGGGHFSGTPVARRLKRPNPRARAGHPIALLFGLAPSGVCRADAVTRAAGELLPHRFTLTAPWQERRFAFCGTFRGVTPPGRYPALCPVEPGLSSRHGIVASDRPSFSGAASSIAASGFLDSLAGGRARSGAWINLPPAVTMVRGSSVSWPTFPRASSTCLRPSIDRAAARGSPRRGGGREGILRARRSSFEPDHPPEGVGAAPRRPGHRLLPARAGMAGRPHPQDPAPG